jgi:hypothetical protein
MRIPRKRFWLIVGLALLLALSVAGCARQPSTTDLVERATTGAIELVVRYMPRIGLPRLTVTYDASGVPSVFGVKTSTISRFLPIDLGILELSPTTVQRLVDSNIQHIEVELNDAGAFVYVNGKALPYLAWNEETLAYAGELVDQLDLARYDRTVAKAIPLLARIGVDVVLTFPAPPGVTPIPVRERAERALAQAPPIAEPTAVVQMTVEYSNAGVPSVAGITSREFSQLLGADLRAVELAPATVARLQAAGIEEVALVTQSDGLHLLVNGREALHLAYTETHLRNAIDLYAQLNRDREGIEEFATLLRNLAAIVYGADVDFVVRFPTR